MGSFGSSRGAVRIAVANDGARKSNYQYGVATKMKLTNCCAGKVAGRALSGQRRRLYLFSA
jgi:hypothetical protein